jgi:hypothetical protein
MDQFMRGNGASTPWGIPAGFDTKAFLAAAKDNYERLQQAGCGDLTTSPSSRPTRCSSR